MTRKALLLYLSGLLVLAAVAIGGENDWPAFRGANALSWVEDDPRLPESWSGTENAPGWQQPSKGPLDHGDACSRR